MALPNSNISTTLVGDTIGSGSRDVGTLCTHPNINKWSKWKPVRFNKVTPLTQENLEAVNYGISWNEYANIAAVKAAYADGEEMFTYARPRGGTYAEYYRLGDFRNYDHSALAPVATMSATEEAQNIAGGQTTIQGTLLINGNPTSTEITMEDINFGQRKLAMALFDGDTIVKTAVAENVGDVTVTMDTRDPSPVLSIKTYTAILFYTNGAGTTASDLAGIPNHSEEGYFVKIVGDYVELGIGAHWDSSNSNNIIYEVSGINKSTMDISLLNCSIRIRNNNNICTSTMQQNEVLINLGDFVLAPTPAGFTATIANGSRIVNRSAFSSWKLCWINGGASPHTLEANIIEEM